MFWNSPADAKTAYWLAMIIYVETDAEELIKESEAKLEEDDKSEPETIATMRVTKTFFRVQLTKKFYGHKLRDFGNNKIKFVAKD